MYNGTLSSSSDSQDEGYSFGSPGLENGVNLGPPCGERKSTGLSRHYTLSYASLHPIYLVLFSRVSLIVTT